MANPQRPGTSSIFRAAFFQGLLRSLPRFAFLKAFFTTWLKLDITKLAAALTIFSTLSSVFSTVQKLALKVYWWFAKFFTASISIASSDRLNREIINWIGSQILTRQDTRILTARTEAVQTDAWHRRSTEERNDYHEGKRVPIQYLPTFGTTWFIYERNIFLVKRMPTNPLGFPSGVPQEYAAAPEGDEPLVVMCLGRSVKPIKRFLETCRDFAEEQRENYITIRASKSQYYSRDAWDTTILRPIRPIETVHFDETVKSELVADIKNYLDPATRRFYTSRGIPYRRGYLLHGTPGTGKTSLALALAGLFGLELYLMHLPTVREDAEMQKLFTALPNRCIVLLEDIDAVGMRREPDITKEADDDDDEDRLKDASRCTLSGLLNVLDGVASQEGRIVLMTSNRAHKLDEALIRPGRIDKMIFLDKISQRSAELMFIRMYARDSKTNIPGLARLGDEELNKLALEFSSKIPENEFTPAQLQGYLLNNRNFPAGAAAGIEKWVVEEKEKAEEMKIHAAEVAAWRTKRREEKKLAKQQKSGSLDLDQLAVTAALVVEKTNGAVAEKLAGKEDGVKENESLEGEAKENGVEKKKWQGNRG